VLIIKILKFLLFMIKNKSFLFTLLLFLNKIFFFFRKKRNFFLNKVSIFNCLSRCKLLNSKNKLNFIFFKIYFKIRSNIKKLIDFNNVYRHFFKRNIRTIDITMNKQLERFLIFNVIMKHNKKIWFYKYNLLRKFSYFESNLKIIDRVIENFIWVENKFLKFESKIKKFLSYEFIFFTKFFFSNYKANLNLNSTLYRAFKKKLNSEITIKKKKIVYLVHQKLIGFSQKYLDNPNILESNFNLFRKIVKKTD
jgi:hypothetical protein